MSTREKIRYNMDDFEKDDEFKDDEEEAILEYMKEVFPKKPLTLQSRTHRKKEAEEAIQALIDYVKETDKELEVKISPDPLVGTSLGVDIKCQCAVFDNLDRLIGILLKASSIDFTPTTDGKLLIGVNFNHAAKITGYADENGDKK